MSKTLGSIQNAKIAKSIYHHMEDTCSRIPKGWKWLGEGISRAALLGPDNVVYKIHTSNSGYHRQANRLEAANFRALNARILTLSNGKCRLAKSRYFKSIDVLAMEYIECSRPITQWVGSEIHYTAGSEKLCEIFQRVGLFDSHDENVWYDKNDILVMFDYAF